MVGVKRKEVADAPKTGHGSKTKKLKASPPAKSPRHLKSSKAEKVGKKKTAPKKLPIPEPEEEDDVESDTTESENGFYGFSAKDEDASSASEVEGEEEDADVEMDGTDAVPKANGTSMESKANGSKKLGADGALNCRYTVAGCSPSAYADKQQHPPPKKRTRSRERWPRSARPQSPTPTRSLGPRRYGSGCAGSRTSRWRSAGRLSTSCLTSSRGGSRISCSSTIPSGSYSAR